MILFSIGYLPWLEDATLWLVKEEFASEELALQTLKANRDSISLIVGRYDTIVVIIGGEKYTTKVRGFTKKGLVILSELRKA